MSVVEDIVYVAARSSLSSEVKKNKLSTFTLLNSDVAVTLASFNQGRANQIKRILAHHKCCVKKTLIAGPCAHCDNWCK